MLYYYITVVGLQIIIIKKMKNIFFETTFYFARIIYLTYAKV